MNRFVNVLSNLFGYMFLALSFIVAGETVLRKVFNLSIQGADELGGYALAVGSSIAFSIALVGRAHIRIDLIHRYMPVTVQAVLNWLAAVLMAAFALMLTWVCYQVISDTHLYGSTAATPWATPLIYPQGVWYAALFVFMLIAVGLALWATCLLVRRKFDQLNQHFHPKGAVEELKDELEDVARR